MNSTITIEFLIDFDIDYDLGLILETNEVQSDYDFIWVNTRSSAFEVTKGVPTGTPGETTAINFKAAFDLDLPTYSTSISTNEVTITAPDTTVIFTGLKILDENLDRLVRGQDYNVTFDNYVEPIDTSNIELGLVRSPYYVNVPFNFNTTTKVDLDIKVWTGDIGVPSSEVDYNLEVIRPTTDFQEFNIDLARLIQDRLEPYVPTFDFSLDPINVVPSTDDSVKWVDFEATYSDPSTDIPDITGRFAITDGYGLYSENSNPTPPTRVLTDCNVRQVSRDSIILFPFINNIEASFDFETEQGKITDSLDITPTNESSDYISYFTIDVSEAAPTEKTILITYNVEGQPTIYTYNIVDECRYDAKTFIFKNKYGVFEALNMYKRSNEALSVTKDQFVNNYISQGVYNTTRHQIKDINIQGKEKLTVNTGYISDSENVLYKQMLVSDQIWLYDGDLIPVRVTNSNIELKTRVNDGLVNYTMEFEYAYNYIQNV